MDFGMASCMVYLKIILFCFARVYMIAEAFISLRSLTAGVYETLNWPNRIPHH